MHTQTAIKLCGKSKTYFKIIKNVGFHPQITLKSYLKEIKTRNLKCALMLWFT